MWQPRIETPGTILLRFRKLISLLQHVHPLTRKWYHVSYEGACYDIDELGDRLVDTIIGRVAKGDFGEPEPWMGYYLVAYNFPDVATRPEGLWLDGRVGSRSQGTLGITTDDDVRHDSSTISYDVFKGMLLAIAEAFEPDWVYAAPTDLYADLDMSRYGRPPMLAGWMIALSPPIARLVQPPAGIISERLADGTLFMAATDETFVTSNPKHRAGAQAIHAVVDPLNYRVPFKTLIDWTAPDDMVK
jgi:hypothetical protein